MFCKVNFKCSGSVLSLYFSLRATWLLLTGYFSFDSFFFSFVIIGALILTDNKNGPGCMSISFGIKNGELISSVDDKEDIQ